MGNVFKGYVIDQGIWYGQGRKLELDEIRITKLDNGYYYLTAGYSKVHTAWAEIEIIKVNSETYHIKMYQSPIFSSKAKPYITIEMSKEQLDYWYNNDELLRDESHYIVRTEGKKFTGKGINKRCINCGSAMNGKGSCRWCN